MPYETGQKILFVALPQVGDNYKILEAITHQFHERFEIVTATNPKEALELVESQGPFAVVISEMQMEQMDGIELLTRVRQINPNSVCILLTNYAEPQVKEELDQGRIFRLLIKPCPQETLARSLAEATAQYQRNMSANQPGEIPEQKQTAKILQDNKRLNNALFEHNPAQIIIVDLEGKITAFNPGERNNGDKPPNIGDVMFKDYANRYESDMYGELMESIRTGSLKKLPEQKYGRKFLSTTISPFQKGAVIITEDITEYKHVKEMIETAAKEWRTTFDSITEMISIHDTNYRIRRVNKAFADAVRRPIKELIGKRCYEVVHKTNSPCHDCPLGKTLKTKQPITKEFYEPNQGIHWEVSSSPIYNDSGKITGIVHIMKDISVRKMAEENLEKINEKLTEHDRLKDEFVTTVSHELRTPLCVFKNIISNALAGTMGNVSPKMRKNLELADENICRLARIISDFLDLSKMDAGKIRLHLQRLSISSVISEVIKSLTPLAMEKRIGISSNVLGSGLFINGDYDKMVQVLTNLIGNAIKFTPKKGHIKVTAHENSDEISVSVNDNGPGIRRKDQKRIFDRYAQARKSRHSRRDGTGLGLPIAKELIEMHGGQIWVESQFGRGTTFSFVLPKYDKPHRFAKRLLMKTRN
jgi:PAS domain S-box-containing protein